MSGSGPSSWRVQQAMQILLDARQRLLNACPDIEDDEILYLDNLDGESGDALQIIERLVDSLLEDKMMAEAVEARKAALAERQVRFERRAQAKRAIVMATLEALNLTELPRPQWTVTVNKGQLSVVVPDVEKLSLDYVKITKEPKKRLIHEAMDAGVDFDGAASLSNGPPTLTIRTR